MMFGSSQSGRFIRHFLYESFNQSKRGQRVFDGMIVSIAGSRRGYFNHEFARTTMWSRQVEEHFQPGDEFPFTYDVLTDPISKKTDGLLSKCRASNTCPKIMQTDNAFEVWQARASLVYTDPLGRHDVAPPENVRYYLQAGSQHTLVQRPSSDAGCQQLSNPHRYLDALRALTVAMQAWVSTGKQPPASRYPRLSDNTLVPPSSVRFPKIPGVTFNGAHNHKAINDYSVLPPRHVPDTEYSVLAPQVDADGNDLAGIRSTALQVPVATYTAWNVRAPGFMQGQLCSSGSYLPFAKTKAARGEDPRPSLEERYGTHQNYVNKVKAAAGQLLREGYLLSEDHDRVIAEAQRADIGLPR
jgi:hypothetical protein